MIIATIVITYKLYLKTPQFGQLPSGHRLQRIMKSPNYIKGRFRNIVRVEEPMSVSKLPTLIKQNRTKNIQKRPANKLTLQTDRINSLKDLASNIFKFTWFGHSSIWLELDGLNILIDPMLGPYASPVPGTVKRFSDTSDIDWNNLPDIDLVLLSHDHYDHLDYYTIKRIKDKVKKFITPLGVGSHLEHWGIEPDRISECYWHQSISFKGINFTSCPTKHFSGRTPKGRNSTLWCSWVIQSPTQNIYFSSDSGYFNGFKFVGENYGPFDLCFVECGQYNTLWRENHMMPEESLQAFLELNGKIMVPIHWGAFSLAPHDWREPIERLLLSANEKGVESIITPRLGQTVEVNKDFPKEEWWKNQ